MPVARRIRRIMTGFSPVAGGGASGITFDSGWSGTGTFADGQIVSVSKSGGGLGLRTDERPLLWIPGETSFLRDPTYSRLTTVMTARGNASIDSTIKPTNAAGSISQAWPLSGVAGTADHCFFSNDPVWAFTTDSVRVSVKRYHNWALDTDDNDKCFRLWPTAFGAPDIYHKIAPVGASTISVEGYTDQHDATNGASYFWNENFAEDTWASYEHLFKESSDNAFDGICRLYRNAGRAHPESYGWKTRNSGGEPGSAVKTQGYLDQFSNPTSTGMESGGRELKICHLYITDTLACFYVSTESAWTQTTMNGSNDPGVFREYQLPTQDSGSDTGCGLYLRKGVHSSLSGLYLWFAPADGSSPQRIGQFT